MSRAILATAAVLTFTAPICLAQSQDKAGAAASAEAPPPKQVDLSQKSLDGLVAAQKEIRSLEAKAPKDAKSPDPKMEAQIDAVIKKNGFASTDDFANASYSVGVVLTGLDPNTGKYIGAEAAFKEQIDEVKADKQMPPKEKTEAIEELNESLKTAGTDKPAQGNINLVTSNLAKLNESLKQAD